MRKTALPFITSYLILIAGCFLITQLPRVPYNVIELFTKHHLYLSILLLASILLVSFGIPVFLGIKLTEKNRSRIARLPLWVVVHSTITWLLLNYTVPTESIFDIVGFPVLGWPSNIETFLRFVALFSVPSVILVGISVVILEFSILKDREYRGSIYWSFWFIVLIAVSYLTVVVAAATDNLTELIAGQGSFFAFLSVIGWILVSFLPGSYLGGVLAGVLRSWKPAAGLAILGLSLSFVFLYFGLEQNVYKYGKTFSALQFLLSPTRDSLVSGGSLALRYVGLETALIIIICISQYPFWKLAGRQSDN